MDVTIKEKILCEANKVISKKGLNSFTLEEVAKGAGISKGGLLYHYPSKDQLIKGLIEYYIEQFDSKIAEREKGEDEYSPNWLIAFVLEQFSQVNSDSNCMAGLLAAVSMNLEFLQPVKEKRIEWLEKISGLKDPIMAMIVSLACYGMAFSNLFCLEVLPDDVRLKIQERLISLSKECY